jgi:hypothetical protein
MQIGIVAKNIGLSVDVVFGVSTESTLRYWRSPEQSVTSRHSFLSSAYKAWDSNSARFAVS